MVTIGFREFLLIAGIVAFMIWLRMFRTSMEAGTTKFFDKLKGPYDGSGGFGWRGLLGAFLVGIAMCCGFAYVVLKIWVAYHD